MATIAPQRHLQAPADAMATSKFTFEYCALYYLNWWLQHDYHYCTAMDAGNAREQRAALTAAAKAYKVVRNLRLRHDLEINLPRLQPALEAILQPSRAAFEHADPIPAIEAVRSQLSAAYGKLDVLSLTTKFLWLRFKHPIIIYDSRARKALDTTKGDLGQF